MPVDWPIRRRNSKGARKYTALPPTSRFGFRQGPAVRMLFLFSSLPPGRRDALKVLPGRFSLPGRTRGIRARFVRRIIPIQGIHIAPNGHWLDRDYSSWRARGFCSSARRSKKSKPFAWRNHRRGLDRMLIFRNRPCGCGAPIIQPDCRCIANTPARANWLFHLFYCQPPGNLRKVSQCGAVFRRLERRRGADAEKHDPPMLKRRKRFA